MNNKNVQLPEDDLIKSLTDEVMSGATRETINVRRALPPKPLTFERALGEMRQKGFARTVLPFIGTGYDINRYVDLLKSKQRIERGTAEIEDIARLDDFMRELKRNKTFGAQVVNTMAASAPFMLEMLATSGLYTIGKEGATRAATRAFDEIATEAFQKKIASLMARKGLAGAVGRGLARTAVGTAGGLLQSVGTGVLRIPKGVLERQLGEFNLSTDDRGKLMLTFTKETEGKLRALMNSAIDNAIEVVSEHSGEGIGLAFGALSRPVKNQAAKLAAYKAFQRLNPAAKPTVFTSLVRRMGWHGIFEEIMEERVGDVAHAMVGQQEWKLPTPEQLAVEFVSFGLTGAALETAGRTIGAITGTRPVRPPTEVRPPQPTIAPEVVSETAQPEVVQPPTPPPPPPQQEVVPEVPPVTQAQPTEPAEPAEPTFESVEEEIRLTTPSRTVKKPYFEQVNYNTVPKSQREVVDGNFWKFHISPKLADYPQVLRGTLDLAQALGIDMKWVHGKNIEREYGGGRNKLITVYPQTRERALKFAEGFRELFPDLQGLGLGPSKGDLNEERDIHNGLLHYRWGRHTVPTDKPKLPNIPDLFEEVTEPQVEAIRPEERPPVRGQRREPEIRHPEVEPTPKAVQPQPEKEVPVTEQPEVAAAEPVGVSELTPEEEQLVQQATAEVMEEKEPVEAEGEKVPQPSVLSLERSPVGKEHRYIHPTATTQEARKGYKAKYRLVDAGDLITSHDPNRGFRPDGRYPKGVQDRDYTKGVEKDRVFDIANNLEPTRVINTTPSSIEGPPLIDNVDGNPIVFSGNKRAMALKVAPSEEYARYREYLREHAGEYGFTPEQVEAMDRPVLVREVDVPEGELGRFASLANKTPATELEEKGKALEVAKLIPDSWIDTLDIGENETLRQYLRRAGNRVVDTLRTHLPKTELPLYIEQGKLTKRGTGLIEDALFAKVLDADRELLDKMSKKIKATMEQSLPELLRLKRLESDYNLIPALKQAITFAGKHLTEMRLDQYRAQQALFGEKEDVAPGSLEEGLILFLEKYGGSSRKFRDVLRQYLADANIQAGGLGVVEKQTANDILRQVADLPAPTPVAPETKEEEREVAPAPAEAPEAAPEPAPEEAPPGAELKEGDRVVIQDDSDLAGRHGVITDVTTYVMNPLLGRTSVLPSGGEVKRLAYYKVKTDQGTSTTVSADKVRPEAGEAPPEGPPDIEWEGEFYLPNFFKGLIEREFAKAIEASQASKRARKPERIRGLRERSDEIRRRAEEMREVYNAWAKQYGEPEQPTPPPAPAAPETREEKTPTPTVTQEAAPEPAPEEVPPGSELKEGDRVVIQDDSDLAGRHGVVSKVLITRFSTLGDTTVAKRFDYKIKTDQGYIVVVPSDDVRLEEPGETAPEGPPDIEWKGNFYLPNFFKGLIEREFAKAIEVSQASKRARKPERIRGLRERADEIRRRAEGMREVYNAWAKQYGEPEQPTPAPTEPTETKPAAEVEQPAQGPAPGIKVTVEDTGTPEKPEMNVRVRFDKAPSPDVRDRLKAAGFRWDRKQRAWRGQDPDVAREIEGEYREQAQARAEEIETSPLFKQVSTLAEGQVSVGDQLFSRPGAKATLDDWNLAYWAKGGQSRLYFNLSRDEATRTKLFNIDAYMDLRTGELVLKGRSPSARDRYRQMLEDWLAEKGGVMVGTATKEITQPSQPGPSTSNVPLPDGVVLAYPNATNEQWPGWVKDQVADLGGRPIYAHGDIALVEGFSVLTGELLYAAVKMGSRSKVDIEAYTGSQLSDGEKQELIAAKKRHQEQDKQAYQEHPEGPFTEGKSVIVFNEGLTENEVGQIEDIFAPWAEQIGKNFLVATKTAMQNPENWVALALYGPYASARSAVVAPQDRLAGVRRFGPDLGSWVIEVSKTPENLRRVIGHELGHILEQEYRDRLPEEAWKEVQDAYLAWLNSIGDMTVRDMLKQRGRLEEIDEPPEVMAMPVREWEEKHAQSHHYFTSFPEWWADEIAKAVVSEGTVEPAVRALMEEFESSAAPATIQPTPEAATPEPDEPMAVDKHAATVTVGTRIADWLTHHEDDETVLDRETLMRWATEEFGKSAAEGGYLLRDLYEAMEYGINSYIEQAGSRYEPWLTVAKTKERVGTLEELEARIPTQQSRSREQIELQQFSTPPAYAYVINWTANIQDDDIVLEPSAGTGSLASFARASGADVIVNEFAEGRRRLLERLGFDAVTGEDARYLDDIYRQNHPNLRPSVVVMNPPFSVRQGSAKKDLLEGAEHVEAALKLLEPGGRLVSIVGGGRDPGKGMAFDSDVYGDWWRGIASQYQVRANVEVDGRIYRKYGTSFNTRVIVIDKPKEGAAVEPVPTVEGAVTTLNELVDLLEGVRNDRPAFTWRERPSSIATGVPTIEQAGTEPGVRSIPETGRRGTGSANAPLRPTGAVVGGGAEEAGPVRQGPGPGPVRTGERAEGSEHVGAEQPDETVVVAGERPGVPERGSRPSSSRRSHAERSRSELLGSAIATSPKTERKVADISTEIYSKWKPTAPVQGAKPHPALIVETTSMAQAPLPPASYQLSAPKDAVASGAVSDVQLEAATYIGQIHQQKLPSGQRRGFLLADGTGVGKSRVIALSMWDHFAKGGKRAVWVSINAKAKKDALEEWVAIGGKEKDFFTIDQIRKGKGEKWEPKDGILFATYTQLAREDENGQYAVSDLIDWLQDHPDTLIAFDESHKAGNLIEVKGKRGRTKASGRAKAVALLQDSHPDLKIIYVSATAAKNTRYLGYMNRLGLWGLGTIFPDFTYFLDEVSKGGRATQEVVMRTMKSMGLVVARDIAQDDPENPDQRRTYDVLQHTLTPEQRRVHDAAALAWQVIMKRVEEGVDLTSSDKGTSQKRKTQFKAQMWGRSLDFFQRLLTSMMVPTLVEDAKKQLAEGNSVVIQFTLTGKAMLDRNIDRAEKAGLDINQVDISLKQDLISFVERVFPTEQAEIVVETLSDGTKVETIRVVESGGQPVVSQEAKRLKEQLLDYIERMRMPESALDYLINELGGPSRVAEVTGRSKRIVYNAEEERVIESRGPAAAQVDIDSFMDGKKRVLVFSRAGGTQRSYHASLNAKNQQKRVHYLLEGGWEATEAVQGLGRTHRSNQRYAPHLRLMSNDVPSFQRFISTISSRLSEIGALSRGERRSAGALMFGDEQYMLQNYGRQALDSLLVSISMEDIPGWDIARLEQTFQEKLTNSEGAFGLRAAAKRLDVRKFLNRLMVQTLDVQSELYDLFSSNLATELAEARTEGRLDEGVKSIPAVSMKLLDRKTVYQDPATGAPVDILTFDRTVPVERHSWNELQEYKDRNARAFMHYVQNELSGEIYALFRAGVKMVKGVPEPRVEAVGPRSRTYRGQLENDTEISEDAARQLWEDRYQQVPTEKTVKTVMVTGAILSVWDRLPRSDTNNSVYRIWQATDDEGRRYLGRWISAQGVENVLERFGLAENAVEMTPDDIWQRLNAADRPIFELANTWKLFRVWKYGEERMVVEGPRAEHELDLVNMGLVVEPMGRGIYVTIPSEEIFKKLVERYPVIAFEIRSLHRRTRHLVKLSSAAQQKAEQAAQEAEASAEAELDALKQGVSAILHDERGQLMVDPRDVKDAAQALNLWLHRQPVEAARRVRNILRAGQTELRARGDAGENLADLLLDKLYQEARRAASQDIMLFDNVLEKLHKKVIPGVHKALRKAGKLSGLEAVRVAGRFVTGDAYFMVNQAIVDRIEGAGEETLPKEVLPYLPEIDEAVAIWKESTKRHEKIMGHLRAYVSQFGEDVVIRDSKGNKRSWEPLSFTVGSWFPHYYDRKQLEAEMNALDDSDPRKVELARRLAEMDDPNASKYGHLERERETQAPGYSKDFMRILPGYINRFHQRVREIESFGQDNQRLGKMLDKIAAYEKNLHWRSVAGLGLALRDLNPQWRATALGDVREAKYLMKQELTRIKPSLSRLEDLSKEEMNFLTSNGLIRLGTKMKEGQDVETFTLTERGLAELIQWYGRSHRRRERAKEIVATSQGWIRENPYHREVSEMFGKLHTFGTVTMLSAFTTVKNLSEAVSLAKQSGTKAWLKGLRDVIMGPDMRKFGHRLGAAWEDTTTYMAEWQRASTVYLKGIGFSAAEQITRNLGAVVFWNAAEDAVVRYWQRPTENRAARLRELRIDPAKLRLPSPKSMDVKELRQWLRQAKDMVVGGPIAVGGSGAFDIPETMNGRPAWFVDLVDLLAHSAQWGSDETFKRYNRLDLPPAWTDKHPVIRLLLKFTSWTAQNGRHLNQVWKYTVIRAAKGDWGPAFRLLQGFAWQGLGGTATVLFLDALKGYLRDDDFNWEWFYRVYLRGLAVVGAFHVFGDIVEGMMYGMSPRQVLERFFDPAVSGQLLDLLGIAADVGQAAVTREPRAVERAKKSVQRGGLRIAPGGVGRIVEGQYRNITGEQLVPPINRGVGKRGPARGAKRGAAERGRR